MLYANVISDIYLHLSVLTTTNVHKTQTKILRVHDVSYFHYTLRKLPQKVLVCYAAFDQLYSTFNTPPINLKDENNTLVQYRSVILIFRFS